MFRRLRRLFFGGAGGTLAGSGGILSPEKRDEIGTERDLLHGYAAALERNLEA